MTDWLSAGAGLLWDTWRTSQRQIESLLSGNGGSIEKAHDSVQLDNYFALRDKYEQKNGLQDKSAAQENNPILAYGFLLIVLALFLKILK